MRQIVVAASCGAVPIPVVEELEKPMTVKMTVGVCREVSGVAEGYNCESYVYLSKCAVSGRDGERERLQGDVQLNLKFGQSIITSCVIHQRLLFDSKIRVPGTTVTGMNCCGLRQVFCRHSGGRLRTAHGSSSRRSFL